MNLLPASLLGLNLSNEQIAQELGLNKDDVHQMTVQLRSGVVELKPEPQLAGTVECRLVENHRYFEEMIGKKSIDLKTLYKGIAKLIIVDISLEQEHDNPQLIFESLNSTGLELSQADLIRNYILMGLEPKVQEELYNHHWYPMEQSFGHTDYATQFDRFMRDYLTVRTGRIPNIREVYESFKIYAKDKRTGSIKEIVTDIHRYSKYFVNMVLEREPDKELRQTFMDISTLTRTSRNQTGDFLKSWMTYKSP